MYVIENPKVYKFIKSTSTCSMCWPSFPAVWSPLIDFNCTVQILIWVAWSMSIIASTPVNVVNLPKSNIGRSITVIISSMSITSTFMRYNTLTTILIPIGFRTPRSDILHFFTVSAETSWAFAWRTVASASVTDCQTHNKTD